MSSSWSEERMFPSSECESTKKHVQTQSATCDNSASLFFSRRTRPARERDARLRFGCDSHSDLRDINILQMSSS